MQGIIFSQWIHFDSMPRCDDIVPLSLIVPALIKPWLCSYILPAEVGLYIHFHLGFREKKRRDADSSYDAICIIIGRSLLGFHSKE